MVEIRCSPRITSRDLDEIIVPVDIIEFPTGEAEYSIYRSPEGRNDNIVFQGIEPDAVFTEFGIVDPKNNEYLPEDPIESPTEVYSPQDTELTGVGQATYNNPTYWKCVKKQYALQFCEHSFEDSETINVDQLRLFVKARVTPEFFTLIPQTFFGDYKEFIFQQNNTPYDILIEELRSIGSGVQFLSGLDQQNRSRYNREFYSEILSEKEVKRNQICARFRKNGVVEKGNLFQLDLAVCDREGQLANLRRNNTNSTPRLSLLDTVSSENLSFSLSEHRQDDSFRVKSNVLFRNQVLDSNFSLLGKEGERTPTRVSSDVRFKDYQIDEYNVQQQ